MVGVFYLWGGDMNIKRPRPHDSNWSVAKDVELKRLREIERRVNLVIDTYDNDPNEILSSDRIIRLLRGVTK